MASCPSCGVAVVPGYVKCPKCGNPLPAVARTKSSTFGHGGGTAVQGGVAGEARSNLQIVIALGVGIAIAIVIVAVLRGGDDPKPATTAAATTTDIEETDDEPEQPAQPVQPDEPAFTPSQPANDDADARAAARELERELKRARLWGTASVLDQRVDIRSGSCDAREMGPLVDAARARLQGAGLTKLRCLAQSGAVVFERDL